jgi:hypothetical protein
VTESSDEDSFVKPSATAISASKRSASKRSTSNKSNKKPKKKRKSQDLDSGTETETERRPFLTKKARELKQQRRIEAADTAIMSRKSQQGTKALKAEIARLTKDNEEKDTELEQKTTELEEKDTEILGHEQKVEEMLQAKKDLKTRFEKKISGLKRNRTSLPTAAIKGMPINLGVDGLVKKAVKRDFWRNCKFLGSDEQLKDACDVIIEKIPDMVKQMKNLEGQALIDFKEQFHITYRKTIRHEINEHRSTVQSNLKKEYHLLITEEGPLKGVVVTAKMMGAIIGREKMVYDPKRPEDGAQMRALFKWYWDTILPKCAGNTHWSNSIRLHERICQARLPNKNGKKGGKRITASTEAYILLTWENSQPRWECERPLIAAGVKINKEEREKETYVGALYSDIKSGNTKYGGWNAAGRNRFMAMIDEITAAKKKPHVKGVEAYCLAALRVEKEIDEKESNRKKKKVKCANTLEIEAAEIPFGSEDEDDGQTTDEEVELGDEEEEEEAGKKDEDAGNEDEDAGNEDEDAGNEDEDAGNEDKDAGNEDEADGNEGADDE